MAAYQQLHTLAFILRLETEVLLFIFRESWRLANYGRVGGAEHCKNANQSLDDKQSRVVTINSSEMSQYVTCVCELVSIWCDSAIIIHKLINNMV